MHNRVIACVAAIVGIALLSTSCTSGKSVGSVPVSVYYIRGASDLGPVAGDFAALGDRATSELANRISGLSMNPRLRAGNTVHPLQTGQTFSTVPELITSDLPNEEGIVIGEPDRVESLTVQAGNAVWQARQWNPAMQPPVSLTGEFSAAAVEQAVGELQLAQRQYGEHPTATPVIVHWTVQLSQGGVAQTATFDQTFYVYRADFSAPI